ncbi:sporulation integral membrane protein YlbJ [Paenibacillus sp. 19GGS1-52]|uniref:sporulation integral membrane protein YlbJ n=1 Tax=Paenibacillus sp. 19GGS1-52 TaxID=2758563 RepID=UPI001EFA9909|nr:sporulation integral membrane protein YlbJ [Paenibacillus sp. 19GGS1-52]ULO08375.1 sporulation integral membrane protein YlbJ [Paenibacillus sp. 19GGS1-52]
MNVKKIHGPLLALGLAGCMLLLLIHPEASLSAALRGLTVWWDVLFPSLFPFFVISEVMLGFGVVHLFGTLLDPLMRPLFGIPGSGGFVAAMGYVSGYPVGAKLTAKLREQNLISRIEGERLVAFTTSSDPIFLLGAVSVGFFHDASLGLILALSHYGAGLLVGLLMSFHGRREEAISTPDSTVPGEQTPALQSGPRLRTALISMAEARRKDGRSLGELMKGAIQSSLQLIIIVGGLVVFFNVLMELLARAGIMSYLFRFMGLLLSLGGFPPELAGALGNGFFEVTLGARSAGEAAASLPLHFKVATAAFILSWGGLSVHAQVSSILNGTGLRYLPFMTARLIHAVLAAGLALLLWRPVMGTGLSSAWSSLPAATAFAPSASGIAASLGLLSILLAIGLLLSLLIPAFGAIIRMIRRNG